MNNIEWLVEYHGVHYRFLVGKNGQTTVSDWSNHGAQPGEAWLGIMLGILPDRRQIFTVKVPDEFVRLLEQTSTLDWESEEFLSLSAEIDRLAVRIITQELLEA